MIQGFEKVNFKMSKKANSCLAYCFMNGNIYQQTTEEKITFL